MTTENTNTRPTHRVYAVLKKKGQEKATWLEIGAAWPYHDGKGFAVKLDFIPRSPDANWSCAQSNRRRPPLALRRPCVKGGAKGASPSPLPILADA